MAYHRMTESEVHAFLTAEPARPGVLIIDDLEEVRRWAAVIGGRYMGADRAEEYGARNGVPGELLIRMTVAHTVSAADVAD